MRSMPDFEIQRPESMVVDKEIEPGLFLRVSVLLAICRTISYRRNPEPFSAQRSETLGLSVFSSSFLAIIG